MKISKLTETIILIVVVFLIFRFGIQPPIPASLLYFYMAIAIFTISLYISISNNSLNDFLWPIRSIIIEQDKRRLRSAIFILLPITITSLIYFKLSGSIRLPGELRSVHPAPPSQIQFRDKIINVIGLGNPLRLDQANYSQYVEEGAVIYFKNCFFCHGDNLDGKGHFASAIYPMPADFTDKGTIAQLQESFVFWRISKGGPGLPNEGAPWNSAMPAWENILTEDEIWKVIMYIYDASGVEPRTWEYRPDDSGQEEDKRLKIKDKDLKPEVVNHPSTTNLSQLEADGKKIYMKKCRYCHGIDGKGDGPAAEVLYPRPRDLTKARYKIKTTPGGTLPTDQDIFRIISNGISGTSMPAWTSLSEEERWQLVYFVKTLAKRFVRLKEKGETAPEPINIGRHIPVTDEGIERGKALYDRIECWNCHGQKGLGDGPNALNLKDDWGYPILPANLWRSWDFKGGSSREDIYRTLSIGRPGTPMPSFIDSATVEDLWHLTDYVRTLAPSMRPKKATVLKSHFIEKAIPHSPDDQLWKLIEASEVPLFGQILVKPKLYTPSIDVVYVKSVFNNEEICFLLEWDDISANAKETTDSNLSDAIAIQFPVQLSDTSLIQRPYFLMGNEGSEVNIWRWDTKNGFREANASGIDRQRYQPEKGCDINGAFVYRDGRYSLMIKRSLTTDDKGHDMQFETNKFIPICFFIWNGRDDETDIKMSLSTWNTLFLEKKERLKKIIYSLIIGIFIAIGESIVLLRIRR